MPVVKCSARIPAAVVALTATTVVTCTARGDDSPLPISEVEVLGAPSASLRLESVATRLSAYDQYGHGYQSKSGPILGPGSERLTVFEPQTEIVATQGDRITHRVWIPVDVISEASPSSIPKPVDIVSGASRKNLAGALEWTTIVQPRPATSLTMTSGFHLEPPFRSWNGGLAASNAFADQNTVVSGAVVGILDYGSTSSS